MDCAWCGQHGGLCCVARSTGYLWHCRTHEADGASLREALRAFVASIRPRLRLRGDALQAVINAVGDAAHDRRCEWTLYGEGA